MHLLIATAALLLSSLALAKPIDVSVCVGDCPTGPPPFVRCRIIGQAPVIIRDCPSRECENKGTYKPGDYANFPCWVWGTSVDDPYDDLIPSRYWDMNTDGFFFPDVYVEQTCAATLLQQCYEAMT